MKLQKCHTRGVIQTVEKFGINLISAVIIMIISFLLLSENLWAATHTAATCSQSDVGTAIRAASEGDVVLIPAGDCTWGASGTYLSVKKAITVQGAGKGVTNITLSETGGTWGNAVIRISAAAIVRSMTINGPNTSPVAAFSTSTANGWRITDIDYNGGTKGAYFVYVGNVYGLIDNNDITGNAGTAELIFVRGPTDSWQTPHSMGGADNVFIEDNTFNGIGYVSDCNSNARCVIRYNTITGPMKVDGHGVASNTPARGVRHMEIYNNALTNTASYWAVMELRGGGGRVFNNTITAAGSWVILTDYGYTATWPNFGNVCQCPANYPVTDQIGVGIDTKSAASEPMYLWNNTKAGVMLTSSTLTWKSTANCTATCGAFNLTDVIKEGRDYFISDTKPAAMSGYTPYTCPHPLAGLSGTCDSIIAGTARYNVTGPMPPRNLKIK